MVGSVEWPEVENHDSDSIGCHWWLHVTKQHALDTFQGKQTCDDQNETCFDGDSTQRQRPDIQPVSRQVAFQGAGGAGSPERQAELIDALNKALAHAATLRTKAAELKRLATVKPETAVLGCSSAARGQSPRNVVSTRRVFL